MRAAWWVIGGVAAASAGCDRDRPAAPAGDAPAPAPTMTAVEAREIFCERVFDMPTIATITGVALAGTIPSPRPLTAGVGECVYGADPGTSVALAVDCRPEHPKLQPTLQAYATYPGARDVDVGLGGVHTTDPQGPIHKIAFFSERPECAVFVSTTGVTRDATEALARHVVARLMPTTSTAP